MLLIDAVYIHESGAKVLLEYFVEQLIEQRKDFFILFDTRLTISCIDKLAPEQYRIVKASEDNRKKCYETIQNNITAVFCFANIPPPISINKIPVYIYFHNVLLLSDLFEKNHYSLTGKLLLWVKRIYIQWKNKPAYHWIVQSERISTEVASKLSVNNNHIQVLPFYRDYVSAQAHAHQLDKFIYVADGVPQKNHSILLQAWEYLYDTYQLTPELHLTIPTRFTDLIAAIELLKLKGIKVINHGVISKAELNLLYQQCGYLIFPSLRESFGLPLLEAVQAGCGVLAADLPYVSDVIEPSALFNPMDVESIVNLLTAILKNDTLVPAKIKTQNNSQQLIALLYKPII